MPNYNCFWDNNYKKYYIKSSNYLIIPGTEEKIEIVNEIPRFTDDGYAKNFGEQWQEYPEDQFDESNNAYKNLARSRKTLESVFPFSLTELKNKKVLEPGSGNGRFTYQLLINGAKVDTFDLSSSINALKSNMVKRGLWDSDNLSVAQANILNMPYLQNSYDCVVCMHVIQHTPNPELTIQKLWKMLKPGGTLIIDHYGWNIKAIYPPIGGFGNLFRHIVLSFPQSWRKSISDAFVKFWFPIHWKFKDSQIMQQLLLRITPVRFYYPWLKLETKEAYFKKALCDTHDGSTDLYQHRRTVSQIRRCLEELEGIEKCHAFKGGNGVLAWAEKAK